MTVFCPPYSDRIAPAWYWASLGGSLCVLALAIWLSSGTMAPYAATLDEPRILEPCGYLANIDYDTLRAPFLMLDGRPALYWDFSVVLRRVGFPLLAYPLMKLAGYDVGGFVASLLLNLAAVLWFSVFVRRAYGDRSAIVTHWILATYPGIPYWAGLPYCYTAIVPSCLVCAILLAKLEHAAEYAHVLLLALGIGTTFIAYDLLPFFVPAGVLILLLRPDLVGRRLRTLTVFCCAAILPTIISNLALKLFFGARLLNDNTSIYYNIIGAYYGLAAGLLHLPRWPTLRQPVMPPELAGLGWGELLSRGPRIFIEDYLFGNFLFLPIFVLALGSVLAWHRRLTVPLPERSLAIAALAVFLFNNLAPPYPGWQLRGMWIPRLYQPLIAFFLLFIAGHTAMVPKALGRRWWRALVAGVVCLCVVNASVAFGPILGNTVAAIIDQRFYKHAVDATALVKNVKRYGRRPIGFCATPGERGLRRIS
jgi:hypothetical protein